MGPGGFLVIWGWGRGWNYIMFITLKKKEKEKEEATYCSFCWDTGGLEPLEHLTVETERRRPRAPRRLGGGAKTCSPCGFNHRAEAPQLQLRAPVSLLCLRGAGPREGGCLQSRLGARLSPFCEIPEIAGQPQATGCRLGQLLREPGCEVRATRDLWGPLTLRPLGRLCPKQTASGHPQRSLW